MFPKAVPKKYAHIYSIRSCYLNANMPPPSKGGPNGAQRVHKGAQGRAEGAQTARKGAQNRCLDVQE